MVKKIFGFLAAASAVVAAVSCEKSREPQDPGNGGSDDDYVYSCTASSAAGYFCGVGVDSNNKKLDYEMYYLSLIGDGVTMTDEGYAGVGAAILIDMNTPTTGGNPMHLSDGRYVTYSQSVSDDYAFYPGNMDTDGNINPTYIYYRPDEQTKGTYYCVTGGYLTIRTNGDRRTITAVMETSLGAFCFVYDGTGLSYADISQSGGDDDDPTTGATEVKLDNLTTGYASYLGAAFTDFGSNYADWILYIGEKSFSLDDASAVFLALELITDASATTVVPDGTYNYVDVTSATSLEPFSMIGGYMDENYYCYGTWYYGESENDWYCATDGKAKVAYVNGNYEIDFEFNDTSIEPSAKVSGKFTANLQYEDDSEAETTASAVTASYAKGRLNRAICPAARRHASSHKAVPAYIRSLGRR